MPIYFLPALRKNHLLTGLGAVVGVLAGGALALTLALALAPESKCLSSSYLCIDPEAAWAGVGMLFGSFPGTIVGVTTKSDRWKKVPLNKLRLTTMPNSNGAIGIGITIPF